MSNNKMLIDAGHQEETRVVMVRGNRVDEFDFESEHKTQLRGNIYLAKVTRVEPSLQAAFVDYGGNRHGFLAFSEIHPDYYQIPMADRQALLDEEAEDAREAAAQEDEDGDAVEEADGEDEDGDVAQAEEEVKAKPARKRRSRRRSKAKDEESEQTETTEAADASDEDAAEQADSDEAEAAADAEETVSEAKDADQPVENETVEEASTEDASAEDEIGDESGDTCEESDDDPKSMAAENDGDDVVSEPAAKPKKAARRPRKKKADVEATDTADAGADSDSGADGSQEVVAETAAEEAVSEESEKPKRRRTTRRKTKKEAEEEAVAEAAADEEAKPEAEASEEADAEEKPKRRRTTRRKKAESTAEEAESVAQTASDNTEASAEASEEVEAKEAPEDGEADAPQEKKSRRRSRSRSRRRKNNDDAVDASSDADNGENGESVEELGSEDALEEVPTRRAPRRHYKIQEVIKRRQILLVQVVKEERGNKGAALTTYLSLAGRYSVLMPNTARGGGISRKITNAADRKRLKSVAANLEVPQGMGVILRTAGASRQPEDIQRDFEYLMRLWENVRNLTLESTAPHLVYEEGSLIKRSIRDLYDKDTGEILVAGEEGYREAKDFMTMLMPNHAKNVKLYRDRIPMFARMGVEAQLDAMLQPEVTLKSGGYIIIDQTEALVAIDVNSGRSTRQHSIEETAVQTNLEAADEVARQLRLRDLAGLIVIDFIDMEEKRNIRLVEKRLKEALKDDRARIQVGRISHFGLMEMSRQRIRASVLESTTQACPTCEGLGHVRATSSVAISVLRSIEEQLNRNSRHNLTVKVSTETALYMLNQKRESVGDLESRFNVSISIATDDSLGNTPCSIERGEISNRRKTQETVQPDSIDVSEDEGTAEIQSEIQVSDAGEAGEGQGSGKKRRRRRRRRKGGNNDENAVATEADGEETSGASSDADAEEAVQVNGAAADADAVEEAAEAPKERVKRTRRKSKKDDAEAAAEEAPQTEAAEAAKSTETAETTEVSAEAEAEEKPKRTRRKRATKKVEDAEAENEEPAVAEATTESAEEESKPRRRTTRRKKPSDEDADAAAEAPASEGGVTTIAADASEEVMAEAAPKKSGWWQRKFF